jgi:hypothetical protein
VASAFRKEPPEHPMETLDEDAIKVTGTNVHSTDGDHLGEI